MANGYIYCCSNASMPGILKIGMTERTPEDRLREANTSDTWKPPTPYNIEFAKKVLNPSQKEKTMHSVLKEHRIHPDREFFRVSLKEVKIHFDSMDGEEPSEEEEPSEYEEEEEDDPMTAMAKTQKQMLTEQKRSNVKKHHDMINDKVKAIEAKEEELIEQLRECTEEKNKLKNEAEHKASEENKAVQIKLDKVLAFLGECQVKKRAERKASGEPKQRGEGSWFSFKDPNQIVNTDTRFKYEQTKRQKFLRYCIIIKAENCVYECDANGTRFGAPIKTLNDFCNHVKTSVNFIGNKKQNANLVLEYYDKCSQTYKKYYNLTSALN